MSSMVHARFMTQCTSQGLLMGFSHYIKLIRSNAEYVYRNAPEVSLIVIGKMHKASGRRKIQHRDNSPRVVRIEFICTEGVKQ